MARGKLKENLSLKGIKKFILDCIFPVKCVGCGKLDTVFCNDCIEKIVFIKSPFCPKCNRLTKKGQVCKRCRPKSNLTGVMVAAHFKEGPLKEAIHSFKYDFITELADPLSKILTDYLKNKKLSQNTILSPVPLHWSRKSWRGFNQSEVLAKKVGEELKIPVRANILKRIRLSEPQTNLKRKDRFSNIRGAFECQNKALESQKIIVLDDVYTTGATLEECAKVLRNAGTKEVWGLVLAKD